MTVSLVQSKVATATGAATTTATFDAPPTAGNLVIAVLTERHTIGAPRGLPTGFTKVADVGHNSAGDQTTLWYRVAQPGDSSSVAVTGTTNGRRLTIAELTGPGTPWLLVDDDTRTNQADAASYPVGSVALTAPGVVIGAVVATDPGGGIHPTLTTDPAFTLIATGECGGSVSPEDLVAFLSAGSGAHTFTPTGSDAVRWGGVLAAFEIAPAFEADFNADTRVGPVGLSVNFTDESSGGTGTPDTWLWDFGDGSTATTQDPTHVYALAGSYTVSLTATTDDDETDTVTKVAYISVGDFYIPPDPSIAVIEIRAAAPGSSRWGSARWGSGLWSAAGWRDVTPQSIDAVVRWGSHQPERGILAETEAGSWVVNTYDPDRLLDPGNASSPYATDLRAGLPIRIRHRGTIVRQGVAESIAFFHLDTRGGIRVTDTVSLLARTPVPPDTTLADTLRARARDVIAAAGLAVTVEDDPASGDPALAPRLEGDRSAWRHVADAAQQTLHVPFVDRLGVLRFRAWSAPYNRGREVTDAQLVNLGTIAQTRGLYSVVQARELVADGGDLVERRLTPTPRYGAVTYTRDEETIDPGAWADAVLADRGLQTVQWIPGAIYPLDADAVEYFATLEAMERFGVRDLAADPPVDVTGIIVGGEIRIRSQRASSAVWSFELELAQTADTPLLVDGADPPEFLLAEAGDEYLYEG